MEIKCPHCLSVDEYYKTPSGFDNCTMCCKKIDVGKIENVDQLAKKAANKRFAGYHKDDRFTMECCKSIYTQGYIKGHTEATK